MEQEKVNNLAIFYYSRKDVQEAIFKFCQSRETIPRYFEGFGKRPDTIEYPTDIMQQVKKGATSFHCSEEIWNNPLEISTELSKEQLDEQRQGWDLLIDIDSKYLDYSKVMAQVLVEALKFHGINNVGIKFSGSKGFHLIIPSKAFPKEINGIETRKMFPEWPRMIVSYLHDIIKSRFIEKISSQEKTYVKDFEAIEKVMPDLVLVAPRHLFRVPYSLHEKTGLVSVVIPKEELYKFNPNDAESIKIKIRNFCPDSEESEARGLLVQALDWSKQKSAPAKSDMPGKIFDDVKIDKSSIKLPPAIPKILEGMVDGKKRALFILINFFRSLNFTREEIEQKIEEWNKKNKTKLTEGYIKSQLEWTFRQNKKVLPPNYDKPYYKDIGIIPSNEELAAKNPVSYTVKKSFKGKWKKR